MDLDNLTLSLETLKQIDNVYKDGNYPLEIYIFFLKILNDDSIDLCEIQNYNISNVFYDKTVIEIIIESDNLELLIYALDNNLITKEYTLHVMCYYGKLNFVKYLLNDMSIKINYLIITGLKNGYDIEIIKYLVNYYNNKNEIERIMTNKMHDIVYYGYIELFKYLLNYIDNVDIKKKFISIILEYKINDIDLENIKYLLSYFNNDNNEIKQLLKTNIHILSNVKNFDIISYLLSYFDNDDEIRQLLKSSNNKILKISALEGHLDMFEYMLSYFEKNEIAEIIKSDNNYILRYTNSYERLEIRKYILNYYPDESEVEQIISASYNDW